MFAVPPNTIALSVTPPSSHPALHALELAADIGRWSREVRYHADGPIPRPVGADLWLMSWLPGQRTDWHDHDGWVGAFTVVAGGLTERVTDGRHRLEPGQTRVFGPGYRHQLINDGRHPAVVIMSVAAEPAWLRDRGIPSQRRHPGHDERTAA